MPQKKTKPKKIKIDRARGRPTKYDQPTTMLAVRVPASVNEALMKRARREKKPKSETAVDILSAALEPVRASVFE